MSQQDPNAKELFVFIRTAVMPLIVIKGFILYFGINYSNNPGEGYGYGLAFTVGLSLVLLTFFVFRQMHSHEKKSVSSNRQNAPTSPDSNHE